MAGFRGLNTSFNFNSSQPFNQLERALAWGFKVQSLRDKGGKLISGSETVSLNNDAPIVAIVSPPENNKQHDAYAQATALWKELHIKEIRENSIQSHANQLAQKLAA